MTMPSFYTTLDSSQEQIRLLRLRPECDGDEVCCTIDIISLSRAPEYEALSYVWGSKENMASILVEDQPFLVTRNLDSALRGIRYPRRERVLWVDAICINQFEEARVERESQVAMMGSIYSQASCVLVYLGEDFEGCQRAMETMITVSNNRNIHFEGRPADEILHVHGVPVADGGIPWDGIRKFFDAPWTTRIWTAQEWALAKKVLVYRSWRKIPGVCIQNFTQYIPQHDRRGCCTFRKEHKIIFDDDLYARWSAFWAPDDEECSLLQLMESYRSRDAGDMRDRVYGLLGLANAPYQARLRPDYKITPEDLFKKVALIDEEITGRLNFLSYCWDQAVKQHSFDRSEDMLTSDEEPPPPSDGIDAQPKKKPLRLPSWVADWSLSDPEFVCGPRINLFLKRYSADGGRRSLVQSRGHRLFTYGVQIGRVRTGCPARRRYLAREDARLMWDFTKKKLYETEPYNQEQSLHTAFWLTMCGGLDALSRHQDGVRPAYERLEPAQYASAIELWTREVSDDSDDDSTPLNNLFGHITSRRGFLITDKGDIGFAPDHSRKNDVVVVLAGGSLPYVLRPSYASGNRNEYILLGDAYVHGFMDGEAFEMVEEGTASLAPFVLV